MGWCSATNIMDAAVEAATRMTAHAWQVASDNEDAKFPAFAQALRDRPELGDQLDDVLRPFVARIAEQLRDGDWDCIEESEYFDRFRQEMLGYDHDQMVQWYRDQLNESDDHERFAEYAERLAYHMQEANRGR